ncbi:DNA-binding response regulator [Pedobacter yulinensis]|uniref:DNA-binding response regulator n=1 Tax=Pedobacter yulinensis TaxID=2126353 RepID=A0A2T3HK63_9SPHI|nr:response regulator transcription factor [Pedobacter yulinensis]PST82809.1 DNA-binding response regulator [Pedobacter yulinensis]
MINIILAEDHNIVRNGIRTILEEHKGFAVLADVSDGLEAWALIAEGAKADIILADISMPNLDGLGLVRKCREADYSGKFIFLSMMDSEKYIADAFQAGADGYLLKDVGPEELIFAIAQVNAGFRYLSSTLADYFIDKFLGKPAVRLVDGDSIDFSGRELEILRLISEGMTNQEMAGILNISKRTVEGHRQTLLEKTHTRNTAALIRFAITTGYVI